MEWHINDLSLDGQFLDLQSFYEVLEAFLRVRNSESTLRNQLYCSRSINLRQVSITINFQKAISGIKDKNIKSIAFNWIATGPFWEDDRQFNQNDYFEYQSNDVTEQGLGEASRRKLVGIDAGVFSFQGSSFKFEISPLLVQQGLSEEPISFIDLDNCWLIEQLIQSVQNSKTYSCWQDVDTEIRSRFEGLIIADEVMNSLLPTPFSQLVTKRIFELLDILNRLVRESDLDGQLSEAGRNLLQQHFAGDKAWFTDESSTNKRNFKQEMTFFDPIDNSKKIFCSWHGKIKTPQIRVHFEWPRPNNQKKIKVVYIGPKITKG